MASTTGVLFGSTAFARLHDTLLIVYAHWPLGVFFCRLIIFLKFFSLTVSTLCFLALLVLAYQLTVKRSRPPTSAGKQAFLLATIWAVAFITTMPLLFWHTVLKNGSKVATTYMHLTKNYKKSAVNCAFTHWWILTNLLKKDQVQENESAKQKEAVIMSPHDSKDIIVNMKLIQKWHDSRLAFGSCSNASRSRISLSSKHSTRIWLPDTRLDTDKDQDTVEGLKIGQHGEVIYEKNVFAKARCNASFASYPVDQQNCTFFLESESDYALKYRWHWGNLSQKPNFFKKIIISDLSLAGYSLRTEPNFSSRLMVDVFLCRPFFFYLARFYLPAFFVVIASFMPLYLSPNSHSKVGLGITVLLTMTTLVTNSSYDLPKIHYLTILDIYLFFCFFSVFFSVVEYALIGYFDLVIEATADSRLEGEHFAAVVVNPKRKLIRQKSAVKHSDMINYIARKLYPFVFALFNVAYMLVLFVIVVNNSLEQIMFKV
ncbi:gamma-aminobutyric acid receptor subunit rho-3-like [Macrosteles quadrilineatus]|uniref:gamma-aminobutyric acid receptor subunit rho-3-like n=1 Tax=Macrosteles quadrilineatus TaxID=74068 RepID=UPI0023E2DFA0|nr:gamma-aminobutyric acid receptor subunit rho-3-like [Macrosteles quadrilineatus]